MSVCLQRKRDAVSSVKKGTEDVLADGERILAEANGLSDSINKEIEVYTLFCSHTYPNSNQACQALHCGRKTHLYSVGLLL